MKHWIEEIRTDVTELSREAHEHISGCDTCKTEHRLMKAIGTGIAFLPMRLVPAELRRRVLGAAPAQAGPPYTTWQLLIAAFVAIISPLILTRSESLMTDEGMAFVFALYGVLIVLMVVPLAYQVLSSNRARVEDFERNFDAVLDHPLKEIGRLLKKPS